MDIVPLVSTHQSQRAAEEAEAEADAAEAGEDLEPFYDMAPPFSETAGVGIAVGVGAALLGVMYLLTRVRRSLTAPTQPRDDFPVPL